MTGPEFERDVLRALRFPAFFRRWGGALPLGFFSPHSQRILRAIVFGHGADGTQVLSLADVAAGLKKDGSVPESVRTLTREVCAKDHPVSDAIQQALADEILKRASLNALSNQIMEQMQSGDINLELLAGELRKYRKGEGVVTEFDPARVVAENESSLTLPTPWPTINGQIEGLRTKELGMVMAVPKVGKTTMLLNISAEALDRGWSVLYVTAADIGYGGIASRLAAIWLDEPHRDVRQNRKKLEQCRADWKERKVRFVVADYSARPCAVADIERAIDSVRHEVGSSPLAVLLDRLEQATPGHRTDNLRRDIEDNFANARMLASQYAVPIWCDSQAAIREGDDGWVDITRGSEARVAKAKVVDLCMGVGVHPENETVLRVQVAGRREITRHRFELVRDPRSGVVGE